MLYRTLSLSGSISSSSGNKKIAQYSANPLKVLGKLFKGFFSLEIAWTHFRFHFMREFYQIKFFCQSKLTSGKFSTISKVFKLTVIQLRIKSKI